MEINIVLIHIGTIYPDHMDDCIDQLLKFNLKVHLVISSSLVEKIKSKKIILSKVEDYTDEKYNSFFIEKYDKNFTENFRDGFWNSTSSRFFILENYTRKNNLQNFYHLEHDNLIFNNLENVTNILKNKNEEMFIVIDSESRCIPSIIFIKNYKILEILTNFIFNNRYNNDMENLFLFFQMNRNIVGNLPILPDDHNLNLISKTGIIASNNINYSNLYKELKIVFDGAALGQYIGGIDPRNDSGNTIGFVNETTIFNVSEVGFSWVNYKPTLNINNRIIDVCNLHIHSKNLNLKNLLKL
jgi:hypothetical protein